MGCPRERQSKLHSAESPGQLYPDATRIVMDLAVPGVRRGHAPPVLARRLADLTPPLISPE